MKNQMFSQMLAAAHKRLAGRDPAEIAQRTGIEYDINAGLFRLQSLNAELCVSWPELEIAPVLDGWHQLLILHYLDLADSTPVCGREISFAQMRDGMVRGGGFDRRCEDFIGLLMQQIDETQLTARCIALGGVLFDSNSDFACRFPFLPNWPLILKIWFADDEFDASGRIMVDASADHYLTIEDAVTAGEILLKLLQDGNGV